MGQLIEEKLSNGVRVLIEENPTSSTASFSAVFTIGARNETEAESGVSHMLEHNLFCGTDKDTSRQLSLRKADIGAYGGASTSKSQTQYYIFARQQYTREMIDLTADMITRSVFPADKFEIERDVILQEIKTFADDVFDRMYDMAEKVAYAGHAYERTIMGTAENVSALKRETMIDYFLENYNAQNLIIGLGGSKNAAADLKLLEERFSGVSQGIKRAYEKASHAPPGYLHHNAESMNQIMASIIYPAVSFRDPDYTALKAGSNIFGSGIESDLFEAVRGDKGLVYNIHANVLSFDDTGLFKINFSSGPENIPQILETVKTATMRFVDNLPEQRLHHYKQKYLTSVASASESVETRMRNHVSDVIIFGKTRSLEESTEEIMSITIDRIKEAMIKTINQTPYMVTTGPQNSQKAYEDFILK